MEVSYFGESVECRRKTRGRRRIRNVVEDGSVAQRRVVCGGGGFIVGIFEVGIVGLGLVFVFGGRIALNERQTHCVFESNEGTLLTSQFNISTTDMALGFGTRSFYLLSSKIAGSIIICGNG